MKNKKEYEKEYLERKIKVNKFFESPKLKGVRRKLIDDDYFKTLFDKDVII